MTSAACGRAAVCFSSKPTHSPANQSGSLSKTKMINSKQPPNHFSQPRLTSTCSTIPAATPPTVSPSITPSLHPPTSSTLGTGLLSMMAARAMGLSDSNGISTSKGMVTACESYLPMVKLMRKVLRANAMEGKIRLINKRSDELEVGLDIPSRADILEGWHI
ncbi:protein arginine N-methyltransferase 7-like isoform X1 [Salvia hispanica]|uniref:protein arginine N-methyltransferase 7-like isoform X1 n=1 Tax=Salvia hispanica TaxID=49212 RepID=UPI0020091785|nr:protein arginine N-methyltransferase 7-like isoform X1 [Salvia hispanica]XP_047947306.1 protein arginine N-methyltransferase 7-like isoform X1 [Salvia hispanica]XP_047947307.1 protein arginine N-methyltransferase 7-like isoform X1 [Salvia hispanica]